MDPIRLVKIVGLLIASTIVCHAEVWTAPPTAAQLKNPLPREDKILKAGRELYLDRCSDCHGDKGKGNGSGAADLEKQPTNFTDTKVHQQSDGELFWKITQGHRPMPGYGKKLTEEQRWQLVHFLRSFAK